MGHTVSTRITERKKKVGSECTAPTPTLQNSMVEAEGIDKFVEVGAWTHKIICPSHPFFRKRFSFLFLEAVFVETIRDGLPVVDKCNVMGVDNRKVSHLSELVGTCRNITGGCSGMSVACAYARSDARVVRQTREYLDQIGGGYWLRKNWKPLGLRHRHGCTGSRSTKNIFTRLIHPGSGRPEGLVDEIRKAA